MTPERAAAFEALLVHIRRIMTRITATAAVDALNEMSTPVDACTVMWALEDRAAGHRLNSDARKDAARSLRGSAVVAERHGNTADAATCIRIASQLTK